MILAEVKPLYLVLIVGLLFMIQIIAVLRCYKKSGPDQALIRTGLGGARVSFDNGLVVIPVIHNYEIINISARQLEFSAIIRTADEISLDMKCVFVLRVNKTAEDVLTVVSMLGVETLNDNKALLNMFEHKFIESIQVVAKSFTRKELEESHMIFKEKVLAVIGTDLNGLSLEDLSLIYDLD